MVSPPVVLVSAGASAAQIQSAIDAAPTGAIIRLAAGRYTFSTTVVIDRDDISIEGAGIGQTTITLAASAGTAPAFQIGAPEFREVLSGGGAIAAARDGATSVTMTGGTAPKLGDAVWISAPNDTAFLDQIGDTLWREDKPLRTLMAKVVAVSGTKVTLERALPMDFPATSTLQVIETTDRVSLSGMTLKGGYGTADPADFTNTQAAGLDATMLLANATSGLSLHDLDIVQPVSNGIVIGKSLDPRVDQIRVTGAHNKGDGGNGYGIEIRDVYDGVFTHLTITDTRHAVAFASYTSAHGNQVGVDYTNRDINFHGGRDSDNVVTVLQSIRDTAAEQSALGSVVFYNPGTTYGAPTDPTTNLVTFKTVIGTVRADEVRSMDSGSRIETLGGNDTLWGGASSDWLDGGTGNDEFRFSGGQDSVIGGAAIDKLIAPESRSAYILLQSASGATLIGFHGTTTLSGVEQIRFSSSTVTLSGVVDNGPVKTGTSAHDTLTTSGSVIAGSQFDDVVFSGKSHVFFQGNGLANSATGNSGNNLMLMGAGNDTAVGFGGRDSLSGGDGHDSLLGGDGNDLLRGDAGNDTLAGDAGADIFYASTGRDVVLDFLRSEGDGFVFAGHGTGEVLAALAEFVADPLAPIESFTIAETTFGGSEALSVTSDLGDGLIFAGYTAASFLDGFA